MVACKHKDNVRDCKPCMEANERTMNALNGLARKVLKGQMK